jgi:hypothetical protein
MLAVQEGEEVGLVSVGLVERIRSLLSPLERKQGHDGQEVEGDDWFAIQSYQLDMAVVDRQAFAVPRSLQEPDHAQPGWHSRFDLQ